MNDDKPTNDRPPAIVLPSEEPDAARHAQPHRPDRVKLHGADNPLGWATSPRRRAAYNPHPLMLCVDCRFVSTNVRVGGEVVCSACLRKREAGR